MEAEALNFMTATISNDWAAFLIRWVIGFSMLPYAVQKICQPQEAEHFPKVWFFTPKDGFLLARAIETLAAGSMILGLCVRLVAILAIGNMAFAYNVSKGAYYSSPALPFLLGFIAILLIGPGMYSLDYLLF